MHTFIENFIADIPGIDLSFPLTNLRCDVVLNDTCEGGRVVDRGHPTWNLAMPDEVMATDDHTISLSVVDQRIPFGKVESAFSRFGGIPFHTLQGGELIKLSPNDGVILWDGEGDSVCCGTKIFLSFSYYATC